ncbi:Sec-independent protein translocase subunit TatA [Nocardia xishanensis]
MTGSLSPSHILVVVLVFVLFFGAKRLPDAARGLGRSMRIFRSEVAEMQSENGTDAPTDEPRHQQKLPPAQLTPTVQSAPQLNYRKL